MTLEPTDNSNNTSIALYQKQFIDARDKMINGLISLADTLPEKAPKQGFINLAKSINPQKKGREEMDSRWDVPVIRIAHGLTKEKPDGAEPGDLYTTSGFILKQPFKVVPLYLYEQNRLFQADSVKGESCFSPDSKYGRPFGVCHKCLHYPRTKNATRTQTDCDNGLCFIVLAQDFKLYCIEFFKTSFRAGQKLDQLASATINYWDRWMSIKTQAQSSPGKEWHIFKVSSSNEETTDYIRNAAEIIYDVLRAQRIVVLEQFYSILRTTDQTMETVNESIDPSLGLDVLDSDDNPDLTNMGI